MHCSNCGATLATLPPVKCDGCGVEHWANPKPCAAALVYGPRGLLLVRRANEPYRGWWDIPGGFCDHEEHPADTARREVREETGIEVQIGGVLGMWIDRYGTQTADGNPLVTLNIYFHAIPLAAVIERPQATEIEEIGWFPGDLPDTIAFPDHAMMVLDAWAASRRS